MVVKQSIVQIERIEKLILLIRGQKVMLDSDLANLYDVGTKRLNEQVKRNKDRFPSDFMFQLTVKEAESLKSLRSQFATLKIEISKRGKHKKYLPYVFTEQGVAMLSSVLKSKRAVQVNIEIMRAFVKLRKLIETNVELARKLEKLEQKYNTHDSQIKAVFEAIRQLMSSPQKKRNPIGFRSSDT